MPVGAPGSLKAWCETLRRFGTMSLADVMQPAIKHAARGYAATPYLHECIRDAATDMLKDEPISKIYLPDGVPLKVGEKVMQSEYAETLMLIAKEGEGALYGGPLGDILVDYMERNGGFITHKDLAWYKTVERAPIHWEGQSIPMTVSVGMAHNHSGAAATDPQRLVAAADQALYAAKNGGRNRVELALSPGRYKVVGDTGARVDESLKPRRWDNTTEPSNDAKSAAELLPDTIVRPPKGPKS